jgi:glycosyltransferase involved in cell wall biosynthesis
MPYPLVTLLTPSYNAGPYISECIESICNQTYKNWNYIIVNNCSSDNTIEIATKYASKNSRIRIYSNKRFVDVIQNHNIAFSMVSSESKYCKVVSADDWLTPDCLIKMVELAEAHPTIGIVGSYQLSGERVRWQGIPEDVKYISGRELCRMILLNNLSIFGGPTSLLYRADLVRRYNPFFFHSDLHADSSACFNYLQYCDFGFVHDILSFERIHAQQESTKLRNLSKDNVASLDDFLKYGPIYLSAREFEIRKRQVLEEYHRWLGGCVLKIRGIDFWKFQVHNLYRLGCPIQIDKIIRAAICECIYESRHPRSALHTLLSILVEKFFHSSD